MPPKAHAALSPSSANRWLHCTRSARLELELPEKESDAAAEGTAAHALCEHKVKKALNQMSQRPVSAYDSDEMEELTDDYRDFVLEQLAVERQTCPDAQVFIETRLDLTAYVPGSFGTCDCLIVSDEKLHIVDFKYGQGVLVDAEENPQMKLYALGALDIYDGLYDFSEVAMTIFQPRRENVSTWTTSVEELKNWAENVLKPKAELAYAGKGEFNCGEWCRFCKAKAVCRKRAEYNLELARHDFEEPATLTDEEIADILGKVDSLTDWANDVKEYALQQAVSGKKWIGWKLVEGRSNRRYTDEAAVAKVVSGAGYDPYEKKLLGISAMSKQLGKKEFDKLLGGLVYKPPGKPTLVPENDERPAMNTAKNDFS